MAGGGAATNSGIDFQARVGALAMASMFAEIDELLALGLGLGEQALIDAVYFETSDGIDDIVLLVGGRRVLIQAKRSLSLSEKADSDFSSVLCQFVRQHTNAPQTDDTYVLATTPSASSRITGELRKLADAARLNLQGASDNPLTKTERDVRDTTYGHIDRHYKTLTGLSITEAERTRLLRKIHVQVLDLESGGTLERAALSVLAARGVPSAAAAWAGLVALALSLAADRLSIDRQGLDIRIGHVLSVDAEDDVSAAESALRSALDGNFPAGRDVILTRISDRLVLAELYRFDEGGNKRLRYEKGRLVLPDGEQWEVIRRAGSMAGMERLILSHPELVAGGNLVIVPINGAGPNDDSPGVQEHAARCRQLLADNAEILGCLRCGRPVAEDQAPYVEIDEVGADPEVGVVHSACLMPMHRVVGGITGEGLKLNRLLKDFDYRTWIRAVSEGQGMFNALSTQLRGRLAPVAWEPGRGHLSVGTWGVVLESQDGEEQFATKRGNVLTLTQSQAEAQAEAMNANLREAAERNDPFCVAGPQRTFGTYSVLLRTAPDGGAPVEIVRATPRELSRATIRDQRRAKNYYAPLLALIDSDTNKLIQIGEAVVLLTDPLKLPDFIANWTAAGHLPPKFGTAIVVNDDQFDSLVAGQALDGIRVVVDPMFDLNGRAISGVVVELMMDLVANPTPSEQEQARK
ncbi:hypothetical protein ACWIF8_00585 [Micromonospora chalcea]